jgi:hypothetical protein
MGGAFVAVADDASAAYWNPGGFAAGNFLSMVLDRNTAKVNPGGSDGGGSGSGLLVAVGMPALGLSYYRLRSTTLWAPDRAGDAQPTARTDLNEVRLDTLVTHHSGVTLVQSIAPGVAIGGTLKVVRGVASSVIVPDSRRDSLLSDVEPTGTGSSKFDADVGVMASAGSVKAGLTVRNVTQPSFRTQSGSQELSLRRQVRAGMALSVYEGWVVAADLDVTRASTPSGSVRDFAAGTEARINRKAFIRGGFRLNTLDAAHPVASAGASYAVTGSLLIDAQVTSGSDQAPHSWGLAARFVY